MIANAAQNFDAEGNLTNESTKNLIRQLLTNLVTRTRGLSRNQGERRSRQCNDGMANENQEVGQ